MRFKDLKLGTKQLIGFGFILIVMAGMNVYYLQKIEELKNDIDEVTSNWLERIAAISDVNLHTLNLRLYQLQHAFATDERVKQKQAGFMIVLVDKINENLDTYEHLKAHSERRGLYTEEEQGLYSAFIQKWETYQDLFFQIFRYSRSNQSDQAVALLNGEALEVFNAFVADLEALVQVTRQGSFESAERAKETYRATRKVFLILLLATGLLAAFMAIVLVRLVVGPVRQLVEAAGGVARGNLDVRLDIHSKDEIGTLADSFNRMTVALREAREKTEQQQQALHETNRELARQKAEVEQSNEELQRAMVQLQETQQQLVMQEKMAALGDLVAGVAHEINTPIGVVKSATDVTARCVRRIEQSLGEGLTAMQRRVLGILKENVRVAADASDRVATLVRSLKTFARLDEAEYQKVDIHEGIDSSLTLLQNELRNRVEVVREYAESGEVECYASQLNQVFIALLKNASAAIEGSGTIRIKTFRENGQLFVQIADTGRGIPPQMLKRVFDFGFSAGGKRVKMRSGLSTAYTIIQRHHGEIRIESQEGKGTTVTVSLPLDGA